jgi:hypothetical protein
VDHWEAETDKRRTGRAWCFKGPAVTAAGSMDFRACAVHLLTLERWITDGETASLPHFAPCKWQGLACTNLQRKHFGL